MGGSHPSPALSLPLSSAPHQRPARGSIYTDTSSGNNAAREAGSGQRAGGGGLPWALPGTGAPGEVRGRRPCGPGQASATGPRLEARGQPGGPWRHRGDSRASGTSRAFEAWLGPRRLVCLQMGCRTVRARVPAGAKHRAWRARTRGTAGQGGARPGHEVPRPGHLPWPAAGEQGRAGRPLGDQWLRPGSRGLNLPGRQLWVRPAWLLLRQESRARRAWPWPARETPASEASWGASVAGAGAVPSAKGGN